MLAMLSTSDVKTFIAACNEKGIATNIGGNVLHTEGNIFALPITNLKFDTFGNGKDVHQYGVAVLTSGESVSVKQLATVDGLNLAGSLQTRLETLCAVNGTYVVDSVREIQRQGRDGRPFTAYAVKVKPVK